LRIIISVFIFFCKTLREKHVIFIDKTPVANREAVLFGSKSTASLIEKHRFLHRKAPLLFSDNAICLKTSDLMFLAK